MEDERKLFFSKVYEENLWQGTESRSGQGSNASTTSDLRDALPGLLRHLKIERLLDLPCGDFNWMSTVDMGGTQYIGGDIVPAIVDENNRRFSNAHRSFEVIDIVVDDLPPADMVFVRDCLIHFSNELIFRSLRNLARGEFGFLCMTHTKLPANWCNVELDRTSGGVNFEFRPIGFECSPFNLPAPLYCLPDGDSWSSAGPEGIAKTMSVWDMSTIRNALKA